jgi:ribulose-5-phosphate 4-epimerase/fuculose-1-phosphate aldolase
VGKNSFVITGTGTGDLADLDGSKYSLIEEYDEYKFYLKSSGDVKPSSEALTHGTIYNLSKEIGAVIHIHSLSLWNFMLENEYLRTLNVPYGSLQMIEDINRLYTQNVLGDAKFAMLGHEEGIVTFGKDLEEAEMVLNGIIRHFMDK